MPNEDSLDWDGLAVAGAWGEGEPLHVLVSDRKRRRTRDDLVTHVHSGKLPPSALMEIENGLYVTSPQLTVTDYARGHSFGQTLGFIEELTGRISIPDPGTDAAVECEPAIKLSVLRRWLTNNASVPGAAAARTAAQYALGNARSVMEVIMYGMFSSPMARGGFACKGGLPNHRVVFGHDAVTASQMPYADCDLYFPKARIDLEYNGEVHSDNASRKHDERRAAGLKAMGVAQLSINDEQLANVQTLEAIARTIYREEGRRFRYQINEYRSRQLELLHELRTWAGLEPVQALPKGSHAR